MKKILVFALISLFCACSGEKKQDFSFLNKEKLTVVITDSGLGGLSVVADIEKQLRELPYYKEINLIFANAMFDDKGYNALQSRDEKIHYFDKALKGMAQKYKPDIIMIACNTLSVIYKETGIAKSGEVPIVGIVDVGVDEIFTALQKNENSKVIIFGTETTIEEDKHRSMLIERGIDNDRIVPKACPQLQQYIEQNPLGENTEMLIMSYVDEAIEQANLTDQGVYASLNCSHFGYSHDLWMNAFEFSGISPLSLINPNYRMTKIIAKENLEPRFKEGKVNVKVVSKVPINKSSLESVSSMLEKYSPKTSKALLNYELDKKLF